MKIKLMKCMALILSLICLLSFPVQASAASQGTEGTEQGIAKAEKLEIFLGDAWAGVEFQLRTDAGKYPDPIPVGENGVLSLEIGGSEHYFLTCQATRTEAPVPEDESVSGNETLAEGETLESTEETAEDTVETTDATTEATEVIVEQIPDDGIPTSTVVIFAVGLLLAIAALVLLHMHQKRNSAQECDADDDL